VCFCISMININWKVHLKTEVLMPINIQREGVVREVWQSPCRPPFSPSQGDQI
jgi:hypothetical protein